MNTIKLPKFNRKEVFEAVDRSNKRFDKYTKEERMQFRKAGKNRKDLTYAEYVIG